MTGFSEQLIVGASNVHRSLYALTISRSLVLAEAMLPFEAPTADSKGFKVPCKGCVGIADQQVQGR